MIVILLILLILFIPIFVIFFFRKHKKNNKNCNSSCEGKYCDEKNECGEPCAKIVCGNDETCYQGSCCKPDCDNTCGSDGCGGTCKCQDGDVCMNDGTCCKPPDCSTGICGTFACGSCECNNSYCETSCCQEGKCEYKNICNSPVGKILGSTWAKFCSACSNEKCSPNNQCDLLNAKFEKDSIIPVSGTISCSGCSDGCEPQQVEIDPNATYYEYDVKSGKIEPRYIQNYCDKDSSGKCDGKSCSCIFDNDCKKYGCSSCYGNFCI